MVDALRQTTDLATNIDGSGRRQIEIDPKRRACYECHGACSVRGRMTALGVGEGFSATGRVGRLCGPGACQILPRPQPADTIVTQGIGLPRRHTLEHTTTVVD